MKAKCSMENLVGLVMGVKNIFNTWSDANTRIQEYGNCGFKSSPQHGIISDILLLHYHYFSFLIILYVEDLFYLKDESIEAGITCLM